MEQSGHVRKVEKAMKEALKNDRARIQVGRISSFGLMEMSRQRLRTGVLEASTKPCPHCEGTGLMRTAASSGLSALRIIEDEAARGRGDRIVLRAGRDAAVYVLNKKRSELAEIEARYGVSIEIAIDESFEGAKMTVDSSGPRPVPSQAPPPVVVTDEEEEDEELEGALVGAEELADESAEERGEGERQGRRRRRRRRGGRGRRRGGGGEGEEGASIAEEVPPSIEEAQAEAEAVPESETAEEAAPAGDKPKRRRRRRGKGGGQAAEAGAPQVEPDSSPMVERTTDDEPPITETEAPAEPQPIAEKDEAPKPRRSRKKAEAVAETGEPEPAAEEPAKPKRRTRKKAAEAAEEAASVPAADNDPNGGEESGEPRRGWWQRTFG
jgi:ribonuclease E